MTKHRMPTAPYWSILLLLATCAAAAQDRRDLEGRLQADYVGKYWVIRGFYEGQNLVFDAGAKLISGGPAESWTLAGIEVTGLKLHDADAEIDGKRVAYVYDLANANFTHQYRVVPHHKRSEIETVKITLRIPVSAEEASVRSALEGVLIADGHDISTGVPDYWRGFLEKLVEPPVLFVRCRYRRRRSRIQSGKWRDSAPSRIYSQP